MYTYNCGCGYSEQLFVGAGLYARDLDKIEKCVPADIFSEFMKLYDTGTLKSLFTRSVIISCPQCERLRTVSEVKCVNSENRTVRFTADCPECGEKCSPKRKPDEIPCPKCGQRLKYFISGHWS